MKRPLILKSGIKPTGAKPMAKKITFPMKHKKSTKGTEVYDDPTGKHPVSQVYVAKSAFDADAPETIKMTIEIG